MSREINTRIAIDVMGWHEWDNYLTGDWEGPPGVTFFTYWDDNDPAMAVYTTECQSEPSYYFDPSQHIAAAALVEDEIERRGLHERYAQRLLALVSNDEYDVTLYDDGGHVLPMDLWILLRATPEQRCRAALAVAGGVRD